MPEQHFAEQTVATLHQYEILKLIGRDAVELTM